MDLYLDFWSLMAYDYAGSWDTRAGHQANLYPSTSLPTCTPFSTSKAVEYYTAHGVPASRIVLGLPLYGRAFTSTEGPVEWVDGEVGASFSYDKERKVMVSYDNVEMARRKVRFIRQNGLGGGMWWESSADKAGEGSLIATVG